MTTYESWMEEQAIFDAKVSKKFDMAFEVVQKMLDNEEIPEESKYACLFGALKGAFGQMNRDTPSIRRKV
jgi:hypothetical protein